MNLHDYRKALISATNGNIPGQILRGWKRAWKSYLRIIREESQPPRDPSDIVFGVIR